MEFELETGPIKKGSRNILVFLEGTSAHQVPEDPRGCVGITSLAPWQTWTFPSHLLPFLPCGPSAFLGVQ